MSAFDQRVCEWLNTATIPPNKKQTVLNRVSVSISNYRALEIDKAHPAAAAAAAAASVTASSTAQTPREPLGSARAGQTVKTPTTAGRKTPVATTPSTASKYKGRSVTSPNGGADPLSPSRASATGGFMQPQLDVDYALQQRIAKALRRLQEGDEGTVTSPLFPANPRFINTSNTNSPTRYGGEGEEEDNGAYGGEYNENKPHQQGNANDMYGQDDDESQPFGRPENETGAYNVGFTFGEPADDTFVGTHGGDDDDDGQDNTMTEREDARRRLTMKRKSRNAISAETVDAEAAMAFTAETVEKDPKHRRAIISSLETHHLFSHLDDDDLAFVADIMTVHTFQAGEPIVAKLDTCDDLLIIVEGEAIVTDTVTSEEFDDYTNESNNKKVTAIAKSGNTTGTSTPRSVDGGAGSSSSGNRNGTRLTVGKTIGDLGLMYHTIQPESVEAAAARSSSSSAVTICCSLSRNAYKNICAKASKVKRERYEGFLANVKFLQALTKEERLRLADALKSAKYHQGDKIIKYGEEGVWFNIILEGRVDVIGRDEAGNEVNVCSFHEGDSVGELEFIYGHKTVADCIAGTSVVKTAKMTANHFEKVIGPAKEVLERRAGDDQVYSYYRQTNKVK